jgi:hypothetical protein
MVTNPGNPQQRYVVMDVWCRADRELAYRQPDATNKAVDKVTDKNAARAKPERSVDKTSARKVRTGIDDSKK